MEKKCGIQWSLAALAAAASVGVVGTADAGNITPPTVECFSVVLDPDEFLSYTGTEPTATILIDDVTYSAHIDPCDTFGRCEFFATSDIGGFAQDVSTFNSNNSNGFAINGQPSVTSSYSSFTLARWAKAKGAYLSAHLTEETSLGATSDFDAFSHTLYGEAAGVLRERTSGTKEAATGAPGWAIQEVTWQSATATDAISHTMGFSTWAVQTSESRHYQTPQVVQDDGKVHFSLQQATSDYGSYVEARVFIKGRVILGSEGAPVESADVTVGSP